LPGILIAVGTYDLWGTCL